MMDDDPDAQIDPSVHRPERASAVRRGAGWALAMATMPLAAGGILGSHRSDLLAWSTLRVPGWTIPILLTLSVVVVWASSGARRLVGGLAVLGAWAASALVWMLVRQLTGADVPLNPGDATGYWLPMACACVC